LSTRLLKVTSKQISTGILRAVAIMVAVILLLLFLVKIQSVIVYITLAAVISLIGRPLVLFLNTKLKFNNTLSVIVTMVLFIALFIGIVSLFIPLIVEQGQNLSLLNIEALERNIEYLYAEIVRYFDINNADFQNSLKDSRFLSDIDFSFIPKLLNNVASGLGSFSIGLFSVLFITFFFLKDSKLLEEGILLFIPKTKELQAKESFVKIKNLLSRYFVGLILQLSILFVIYTAVLLALDINNAVVIAFLCAILNIVPYIGPIVSSVIMLLLTMSSNLGASFSEVILPKAIYVMLGFIFAQLVDNFFSQPFIFSKSVKSHPLEIFLVIIIAGLLFGIIGMVVAVPGYTAIKVILKIFMSEYNFVQKLTKDL